MSGHSRPNYSHLPKGLTIIYEDSEIIAVDKPPGMLTMGTDKEKERTAYFAITDYVRKGYSKSYKRIFIVHRLDRETSGIVIFARTEKAKLYLQEHWKDTRKKYLAVVYGRCEKLSETITSYLAENKAHVVYSTEDREKGKLSHTSYRVLKETKDFSLLEVGLLTGRKHQIRVHLAGIGNPIVGDVKYGREDDVHRRMALHALSISFKHPAGGKECYIETEVPEYFNRLVGVMDPAIKSQDDKT